MSANENIGLSIQTDVVMISLSVCCVRPMFLLALIGVRYQPDVLAIDSIALAAQTDASASASVQ